jgi:hypothetical protein
MKMKSIALVGVYLGKLPVWIDYFTETCRTNPTVDWMIFTDDTPPVNRPDNVRFLPLTMEDVKSRFSEKLDFPIGLKTPYKMCDFKPSYGFQFADHLKGYDFWGHIDLDVLYGDIRAFMTESVLNEYDVISADSRRMCGVVTLYRNNEKINTLFKESSLYKKVYMNESFDYFCENKFDDTIKELIERERVRCLFGDFQKYGRSRVPSYWVDGRMITRSSGQDSIFLHLRPIRKTLNPRPFGGEYSEHGWKITKRTIRPLSPREGRRIRRKYFSP